MRIFQIIVRRVAAAASGTANFLGRVSSGARVSTVLVLKMLQRAGTVVSQAPAYLVTLTRSATRITATVIGDIARPLVRAGSVVSARIAAGVIKPLVRAAATISTRVVSGTVKPAQRSAGRITRIQWDLVHTGPVTTAVQDPGGNWTNENNFQGAPDGAVATLTEGIVLVQGTLRGSLAAQPNRPPTLVISKVELLFYIETVGIVLITSTWSLGWRLNGTPPGAPHVLEGPSNANVSSLVAPRVFDITEAIRPVGGGDILWADIAALQPFMTGTIVVDAGLTRLRADACRVRVTAREVTNF